MDCSHAEGGGGGLNTKFWDRDKGLKIIKHLVKIEILNRRGFWIPNFGSNWVISKYYFFFLGKSIKKKVAQVFFYYIRLLFWLQLILHERIIDIYKSYCYWDQFISILMNLYLNFNSHKYSKNIYCLLINKKITFN